jgi:DNA-binding NarL/FixJ family response regulator
VTIRAVIVDDQELMRTGFSMILSAEPDIEVVGVANDGQQGVELIRQARPDVALMDIRMPEMDGLEATATIQADPNVDTRVLILTTFDLDEYVFDAVRAGASGFLLKDSPADELARAVRVLAAGNALLGPSVTRTLIEEFSRSGAPTITSTTAVESLTDRETEVWQLLARGLSNHELAETLIVSETTVKTHVSRVLMKLGVRDRVQAVVAAYETGLVRPGD